MGCVAVVGEGGLRIECRGEKLARGRDRGPLESTISRFPDTKRYKYVAMQITLN